MEKNRGRMQSSIDEWRERAETEMVREMIRENNEKNEKNEAAEKTDASKEKFVVRIPDGDTQDAGGKGGAAEKPAAEKLTEPSTQSAVAGRTAASAKPSSVRFDEMPQFTYEDGPEQDDRLSPKREAPKAAAQPKQPEQPGKTDGAPYDEFASAQEAGLVREELRSQRKGKGYELLFGGILTAVLILLDFAPVIGQSLPYIISWKEQPFNFAVANIAVLLATGVIFFSSSLKGFFRIFTGRADGRSLTSVAFIGVLAGSLALAAQPKLIAAGKAYEIAAAAALCLFFNALGEYFAAARIDRNFQFVAENDPFTAAERIDDIEVTRTLTRGVFCGDDAVCNAHRVRFLTDFLANSHARTLFDSVSRAMAPAAFGVAALGFVFVLLLKKDAVQAVTLFAILCCIGAPLTGELGVHLPMWRTARKLRKKQALLTGYSDVTNFSDVNAFVVDARDLFPKGSVRLHGIKSFSGGKVDDAIVDAASLVCAAGGTLAEAFMKVIYGKTELLRSVQSFEYEDGGGLTGWVSNRRVMLGSRELMARHGIGVPPHAVEAKYTASGREVVYLAVSSQLCAMLIVNYDADPKIAAALRRALKFNIALLVRTSDPNITDSMLAEKFDLDEQRVKVLTVRETELIKTENTGRTPAGIAVAGNAGALASALTACVKLRGTAGIASVLQIVGAVLGLVFMGYISVTGQILEVTPLQLIAYQLVWAVPVGVIALFRRH